MTPATKLLASSIPPVLLTLCDVAGRTPGVRRLLLDVEGTGVAIDKGDEKSDASVSLDATRFSIQARLGFSKGRRLRSGHIGFCYRLPSERG